MRKNRVCYKLTSSQNTFIWPEIFIPDKKKVSDFSSMTFYFTINENPDLDSLRKSYQKLIRNNDSLRIAVERVGFGFRQYICDYVPKDIDIVTLSNEEEFNRYVLYTENIIFPFCSDNHVWGSVASYDGKASLVMRVHHLCMDGYSLKLIFEQLSTYYDAYSHNQEPPDIGIGKITDYFTWQTNYIKGVEFKKDLKFWADRFIHQRRFKIPVPRAPVSGACSQHIIVLDSLLYNKVEEYCKRHSMSLIQIVMVVSGLVVYILTGKDNFALCTITHGRRTEEFRRTVGCMMNIYPIFFDIDSNYSMEEYRKYTSKQYFDAMMHSRFSHSSQVPLTYYEAVKNGFRFNPYWIVFSSMDYAVATNKSRYGFVNKQRSSIAYHFYCSVIDYSDRGEIKINYRTKIYSHDTILLIEREFRKVLEKMISYPNASIL